MVSGFGFESGYGRSSSGYSERRTYRWGRAEMAVNDRLICITDFGRKLTYNGYTFDIHEDVPLMLVIDATGRVSRVSNSETEWSSIEDKGG